MLSLNILNSTPTHVSALPKNNAKTQAANGDKSVMDFSSYIAMVADAAHNAATQPANTTTTTAPAEKGYESSPVDGTAAQRANEDIVSKNEKPQHAQKTGINENSPATTKASTNTRPENQLSESLGLLGKNAATQVSKAAQKHLAIKKEDPTLAVNLSHTIPLHSHKGTIKNAAISTALLQLQKTPDTLLLNVDGLRRLSEKLGVSFLQKVEEKLNAKKDSQKSHTPQSKTTSKEWVSTEALNNRVQKAGDTPPQNNAKNTTFLSKAEMHGKKAHIVSRETISTNVIEKQPTVNTVELKPITHEKNNQTPVDIRLSDSVSSVRTQTIHRTAIENTTTPAALSRQLTDVMARAHVLIADSQNAQFTVKLFPREIGRMEIDLKMVEGEIRGKIVVENEEVKSELQNFLNQNNNKEGESVDLNRVNIEVRNGNQQAANPEKSRTEEALLQDLVVRAATSAYEASAGEVVKNGGLYA
ncbi:MAG TPA: hypothetical protein PLY93_00140 [Turneriella sp.]|nr:hypothetical protein [Turneriella sp.]